MSGFNCSAVVHVALLSARWRNTSPIEKWVVRELIFLFLLSKHSWASAQQQRFSDNQWVYKKVKAHSCCQCCLLTIVLSSIPETRSLLPRILSDWIFLTVAQEQLTWRICIRMRPLMVLYPIITQGLLWTFIAASIHALLQRHVMDYENHNGGECICQLQY